MSSPKYSAEFDKAWSAYRTGLTPQEKGRCLKAESYRRWTRLGLDKALPAVLDKIKELEEVYSQGYRPGFQVWIKQADFDDVADSEAVQAPLTHEIDWGALSVACKKEATRRKLHTRHKYFHNPASIYWALSSIHKGEESGPATVERVLELALERAGRC